VILIVLLRRDKQEFALRHVRDLQVAQSTARCPIALRGHFGGGAHSEASGRVAVQETGERLCVGRTPSTSVGTGVFTSTLEKHAPVAKNEGRIMKHE
jgi:hypothetical protein